MRFNLVHLSSVIKACLIAIFLGLLIFTGGNPHPVEAQDQAPGSEDGIWVGVDERSINLVGERTIIPTKYRTLTLNPNTLVSILEQAPLEFTPAAQNQLPMISIPLVGGGFGRFLFVEAPIMAPELGEKFPEITTYLGRGLDDPTASVRFDWTPAGFHAMIISSSGTVFVDPYSPGDTRHHISYYKHDYVSNKDEAYQELGPLGDPAEIASLVEKLGFEAVTSGNQLRTYRAAVAATGEYTQFHGGSVNNGMAAIVTTMNRVVGIYEREVAVRMELVANNNLIVYTNGGTDPYTNNDGYAMLLENQNNLDSVIGDSSYDIGHVFSTGGGGVAYLGVPCESNWKARGVTGRYSPVGDPFDVDYVAHEMGHQFGANHTFNGNTGSCSGGNRNGSTAYEPGSASTIMGYAGICGIQDLQPNSDPYFHGVSFDEIIAYTTIGGGKNCPATTTTGNSAPSVDAGTGGFTIPINTPFTLTGSATDPNGDPLNYGWEEFDLGPAGHPDTPSGNAPIFRSFNPVTVPDRTFPKISNIVNDSHTIGELLPTYDRDLTFRLTVRDNHNYPSAGGVGYDTISFYVRDEAGPFLVTSPNTAITWSSGRQENVTWDVANTDNSPVNCTGVDITLSTDGGYTYPITMVSNTPNDGSATITIPNTPTTSARVKVACANNIFFDISNVNFEVIAVVYIPLMLR
jgi:hypothetical protein